MPRKPTLPVDELLTRIVATLATNPCLIVEAEPGAGKTTRVPAALLEAVQGQVLVLEPRRIAARMAARRVAWEMDEELGQTVGYQVRFERVAGPKTRLHFLTDGVLTRRLLSDPELAGVDLVILDEFHERHLETDLVLALLRRLQQRRPELKIVVMSATLDAEPIARYLGGAPVIFSSGRVFDLELEYTPYSPAPVDEQVRDALERVLGDPQAGEVLVFLPGVAEIRRCQRSCEPLARRYNRLLLPLHGDLTPAEQDAAVNPSSQGKVILATNVAESSITIDGVRTVIDSGQVRTPSFSPWTGLPTLRLGRTSKASARQRAGRAARTAPGRCIRLYAQNDFQGRRDFEEPEILRADLTQFCLALRALGVDDPAELEWLDAPPRAAVESAEELISRLMSDGLSAGQLMRLPLHPRLARMIEAAGDRGVTRAACRAAALVGSGERPRSNDLLEAIEQPFGDGAERQFQQLLRLTRAAKTEKPNDEALLQAVLLGFPDRVARLRAGNQVLLANGGSAEIVGPPPAYPFFVALDVEERTDKPLPQLRLFARIEPEWLLDHFPNLVRDETVLTWNRQGERVDAVSRMLFDRLVIDESQLEPDAEGAAALLAEKAIEAGLERFTDPELLEDLAGRLEFAGIEQPPLEESFRGFCVGMKSFDQLKRAADGFVNWLEQRLDDGRLFDKAPRSLRLKAGRQVKIHYQPGKTPWVSSRMQDFFGMQETPRIGPRKEPVVVHLLAPSQRPVQITSDLAGFWERHYPSIRRELMRRYPRHKWPEDPNVPVA